MHCVPVDAKEASIGFESIWRSANQSPGIEHVIFIVCFVELGPSRAGKRSSSRGSTNSRKYRTSGVVLVP